MCDLGSTVGGLLGNYNSLTAGMGLAGSTWIDGLVGTGVGSISAVVSLGEMENFDGSVGRMDVEMLHIDLLPVGY
jgi:hypothetical protein